MNEPAQLSLEQQFNLQAFKSVVSRMSHEQAQDFLVKLYEHMTAREVMYRKLLKHQWGIGLG